MWEKVGYYLGVLCLNIIYVLFFYVIVLGGGIMKWKVLYGIVRRWFKDLFKGYLVVEKFKIDEGLVSYIRESIFGDLVGIIGVLELVRKEVCEK